MKNNILTQENISGKEKLNLYLSLIEKSNDEFKEVKLKYEKAVDELQKLYSFVNEFCALNDELIVFKLEAAFYAGFDSANTNYNDLDFECIDYDDVIKATKLHINPDYIAIATKLNNITKNKFIQLSEWYDGILEYQSFLETYIPKIAHYYGFIIGCIKLSKGTNICNEYKTWLSEYLNCVL